ncbi:MAG: cation diffusion facilitator family transporter [Oscillospiraceae bacterium]|nr:cation diffusion facilitator family transporter [Oscillospiraceae bacterium]
MNKENEQVTENNINDAYKSQQKVSMMTIISELPNLVALTVMTVLSGSVIMALDTFESFANVLQGSITHRLSKKMQGDASFKYDYGMGKIDAFGSLISASILFLGLAAILAVSINSLISPSSPSDLLFLAIIIKVINVAIDILLLYKQQKVVKQNDSPMVRSAFIFLKKDLITDLVVLVTVAVAYIFRAFPLIVYFEPIVCILCVIYVAFLNVKQIRNAASNLLDKTLDEETQMQIINCVTKIWAEIDDFKGVRTRRSSNTIFIDLLVTFEDETKYSEILKTYEKFEKSIKELLPDSVTSIVIGE